MQSTETCAHSVPLHGRVETDRRRQTTPLASMASRTTPVDALSHGLVSTHAQHAADWSVDASQTSGNRRRSAGRSCRRARPCTPAPIAPKLAPASSPAMVIAREQKQAAKPCSTASRRRPRAAAAHAVPRRWSGLTVAQQPAGCRPVHERVASR